MLAAWPKWPSIWAKNCNLITSVIPSVARNLYMVSETLFKKIPFWLKFAILFVIVFCLFSIGPLLENTNPGLLGSGPGSGEFGSYFMAVFILLTFPIFALTNSSAINFSSYWCWSVIYIFIVGSVVGLIIQFIKLKIKKS